MGAICSSDNNVTEVDLVSTVQYLETELSKLNNQINEKAQLEDEMKGKISALEELVFEVKKTQIESDKKILQLKNELKEIKDNKPKDKEHQGSISAPNIAAPPSQSKRKSKIPDQRELTTTL
eukprot:NODE_9417_length_594_cov_27.244161_g8782_i0.p1 GENE.NODE_9417_length_594_cov_27.244161_g8782_i0~~NODE_9417_length_594_cov_27.244161_g8782_i0.p1  ORF type:complete len:122 (-),score=35.42 NODE_9417_length_594_cov_27.244161_g8782_i0:134-499(-)